ncbi:MAG TPA: alginate lyase family protein [Gemmatimonadaceae bacterium]
MDRLRAMSAGELAARSIVYLRSAMWRRRRQWRPPSLIGRPAAYDTRTVMQLLRPDDLGAAIQEAESLLRGSYRFLNHEIVEQPLEWHRDPQTRCVAPSDFAFDLDYRDTALTGNVKNIWEKSRHHHVVVLCVAFVASGDGRFANAACEQLLSWIDDNPVLCGVNWSSTLELALRLISWVWVERLLRGTEAHARLFGSNGAMWPAVYWHQYFIWACRSRGSSANNHLIGEMTGLFIAASAWPTFAESARWRMNAMGVLKREADRQVFPCGLNREHAFGYHIVVLEQLLMTLLEDGSDDPQFVHAVRNVATRMFNVLAPLTDIGGHRPRYGDADDAVATQLRPSYLGQVEWLTRLATQFDIPQDSVRPSNSGSIGFQSAGLYVLGADRGTPEEIFCVVNAGPLGYQSIAAHAHADALAFSLSLGGTPVIVDCGTGGYFDDPWRRRYFRGTAAHNTLVIDGQDQSRPSGPFMWSRHARTTVESWTSDEAEATVAAHHDGYRRLVGRPVHRRTLRVVTRRLEVTDELLGRGIHEIEWRLHFAPDCLVEITAGQCKVSWTVLSSVSGSNARRASLVFSLDSQLHWAIVRGDANGGWYSAGFNLIEPTNTLVGRGRLALPLKIYHNLEFVCA